MSRIHRAIRGQTASFFFQSVFDPSFTGKPEQGAVIGKVVCPHCFRRAGKMMGGLAPHQLLLLRLAVCCCRPILLLSHPNSLLLAVSPLPYYLHCYYGALSVHNFPDKINRRPLTLTYFYSVSKKNTELSQLPISIFLLRSRLRIQVCHPSPLLRIHFRSSLCLLLVFWSSRLHSSLTTKTTRPGYYVCVFAHTFLPQPQPSFCTKNCLFFIPFAL
ncbi:hypothetical protein BDD12DRAFT_355449 [Trichophaea hybrida]|nr:hypothetical protein BDD12DRAFT_544332 [Trichophaea hybrida]KAF8542476.1 hypothetical protein BDD12DRAFT_355449 [Trichophaea hybrida]